MWLPVTKAGVRSTLHYPRWDARRETPGTNTSAVGSAVPARSLEAACRYPRTRQLGAWSMTWVLVVAAVTAVVRCPTVRTVASRTSGHRRVDGRSPHGPISSASSASRKRRPASSGPRCPDRPASVVAPSGICGAFRPGTSTSAGVRRERTNRHDRLPVRPWANGGVRRGRTDTPRRGGRRGLEPGGVRRGRTDRRRSARAKPWTLVRALWADAVPPRSLYGKRRLASSRMRPHPGVTGWAS